MQTEYTLVNKINGAVEAVIGMTFAANFIIVNTATQSVRLEKTEDGLFNENFEVVEGVVEATEVEEVAIEEEAADVIVDPAAGTVTGVDVATEGGDTTVTETVGEVPAAPVTETTETTEPAKTE
jgi:hypothetical protein